LGLQLAGFLIWSAVLYNRFALTFDFAIANQAWTQIAHGNLDPSTLEKFPFWQDHSEFIMWPLALFYWVWPHAVTMLWIQDLCVVGAELVAFTWLSELAGRRLGERDAAWLTTVGLVLLAANPWIWWAISFDFHFEAISILFTILLARDLASGRRRAWAWVVILLACGDVAGTYLAGLGLGGALASRRSRVPGMLMACLGVAATLFITLIHGNRGSGGGLHAYAYLTAAGHVSGPISVGALAKGILTHPGKVVRTIWLKRVDVLANLAPAGLLGIADLSVLPLMAVVLLANTLFENLKFAEPIFQYLPVYVLLPVGTVAVLARLVRHHRAAGLVLACFVTAQTLAWAVVWAPHTSTQWLRISRPTAATITDIAEQIPASAEVIASQGIMGRFGSRAHIYSLSVPGIRLVGPGTWFVIVPVQGVEMQTTASAMGLIAELAGPLHATLEAHANGVWAFRWNPPPGVRTITIPAEAEPLPAWAAPTSPGDVGRPVIAGPTGTWHVRSASGRGYIADGLAWQLPTGRYQAHVTLSATMPVSVEVWNDNGDVLLARRSIPPFAGTRTVVFEVDAMTAYHSGLYSGWGPFRADFVLPPPGQRLEVRVWTAGGGTVNVYRAALTRDHEAARSSSQGHKRKD
jgi:uncharacterized membrane protein